METRHIIRLAIAVSVVGHLALLTGFLLADVRPFDPVTSQTIAVEVVTSDEVKSQRAPEKPELEKATPPTEASKPESAKPQFQLPELSPVEREQAAKSQASPPEAAQQKQQQPSSSEHKPVEAQAVQPKSAPPAEPASPWLPQLPGGASPQQAQPQQAAPSPPQPAQSPERQQPAAGPDVPPAPEPDLTVKYGVLLGLPDGDGGASAFKSAALAPLDIAAFKRHLKSCSRLPASVAPGDQVKVVLRVMMAPGGRLLAEPEVMEAKNSKKAPALMRAAVDALNACQPYTMLPPDKYDEWKMLDLVFTPADFTGG